LNLGQGDEISANVWLKFQKKMKKKHAVVCKYK
jgi:hypothetical protein